MGVNKDCYRDEKLKTKIHVFRMGGRICSCGQECCPSPEFKDGRGPGKKSSFIKEEPNEEVCEDYQEAVEVKE